MNGTGVAKPDVVRVAGIVTAPTVPLALLVTVYGPASAVDRPMKRLGSSLEKLSYADRVSEMMFNALDVSVCPAGVTKRYA